MKQIHINTLLFVISTMVTQHVICQFEKFGQMMYTTPPGWKLTNYQNGALITPSILPAKEFLGIEIFQSISFSGGMQQALEKCYNETCNELQVTKMNEVSGANYNALEAKTSFRGWEYIRCSGGMLAIAKIAIYQKTN